MADIVIRPSMKFIKAGYVCALLVVCAAIIVHYKYLVDQYPDQRYPYLPIASLLALALAHQATPAAADRQADHRRRQAALRNRTDIQVHAASSSSPKCRTCGCFSRFGSECSASEIYPSKLLAKIAGWWWKIWIDRGELAEQITDASAHSPSTGLH